MTAPAIVMSPNVNRQLVITTMAIPQHLRDDVRPARVTISVVR